MIIFFKHCIKGATRAMSSAWPKAPAYDVPTWHPKPECSNCEKSLSIKQLNNRGEMTPPCFTQFDTLKLSECSLPHFT